MSCQLFSSTWIIMFLITDVNSRTTRDLEPNARLTNVSLYGEIKCLNNVTLEEISKIKSSITSLCIRDSFVPQLRESTLSRFTNLRTLAIVNSSLTEVLPNALSKLYGLNKVDLADNKIVSLPHSTFQSNQNLQELSLRGNNISEVKELMSTLARLKHLRSLDLRGNTIKNLDVGSNEFPNLEIINLKENRLSAFSASAFPSLRKLYLGNNFLKSESLDLSSLNSSDTLEELHLGNVPSKAATFSLNYFQAVDSRFLPYLPSLHTLDLQNCDISSIDSSALGVIPQLQKLILRSNNFPTIPSAVASAQFRNLRHLDMSYNGKKEVPFDLESVNFTNIKSLSYLNLSFTKLRTLPEDSFNGLSNLTILSLSNTELADISPNAFRSLKSLLWLDLSNNHLTVIVNDTFADLVSLTYLKISHNSIKIYPINHPFLPTINLRVLEFQHNSLCELWSYLIVHLSNLTYIDMSYNKIVEWKWVAFPSSGNLKVANFEDNEIKVMTQPMLKDLLALEKGVFSNNPYNCTDCDIVNVQELLKSPKYSPYKNGYRCQNKYLENDIYVYNATIRSQCFPSSLHYVGLGIGTGLLLILTVTTVFLVYHFRWYLRYRWFLARCHLKTWHKPLQRKQSYLYDAFISYSDKDRYWLKNEFLPRLENDFHFHFCVHDRDFQPGRDITDNILEGIDRSKMFIAILTENFLTSQWCMWEMNMAISKMAIEQNDNLVIIKLHHLPRDKLPRQIQYMMKTKTYLGWPVTLTGQRLFWEKMIHTLKKTASNSVDGSTANPV